MRRRLIILLALIVVTPLVILGWLGARLVRGEQSIIAHRHSQFMLEQLRVADQVIAGVVGDLQRRALEDVQSMPSIPDELRDRARRSPSVTQYFLLASNGDLAYPSPLDDLSVDEEDFLNRTREIWERQALTHDWGSEDAAPTAPSFMQKSAPRLFDQSDGGNGAAEGWYSWHWGDGLHIIYWLRDDTGRIRGAELSAARLKADIVAALPDTPTQETSFMSRLTLADAKGAAIYVWGSYEPGLHEKPRSSIPLSYPLGVWSLNYYGPAVSDTNLSRGLLFNLFSGLALLTIALVGMTVYFFRESSRELREAVQRVTFVNQVSHELKTPLTNIRMYAELLDEELDTSDETPKRHVSVIVDESRRLSRLINNILTFSRKERETLRLHRQAGVVDDIIRTVLDHYGPSLQAKAIETYFEAGAPQRVLVDADLVEQIVGNLIGNVEKYGARGKLLKVTTAQQDETVTIVVSDRGPGVPERERGKVFEPFYRISSQLSDGVTGTGIGLTIARELAQLHGGNLVLEPSEVGARFRLTLHCPRERDGGSA